MEGKFKAGLANATFTEFENVKNLREECIQCGAEKDYIEVLEGVMGNLYDMYLSLSR